MVRCANPDDVAETISFTRRCGLAVVVRSGGHWTQPHAAPRARHAAEQWLRGAWAIAHPPGTGRVYPNFPDPDLENWPESHHGANFGRLVHVKRRYDPDNVFHFHQSVPPR